MLLNSLLQTFLRQIVFINILCFACIVNRSAAQDDICPNGLLDTGYRGVSCLHCLHSQAPQGVTPFVELLKKSCIKNPMIAFVVDGSFGWDAARINEAIEGLASDGRSGRLHLYVYNGPAQRRWASGFFNSFAEMHPATFLKRIKSDAAFREEFRGVVRERIVPAVAYATSLGVKVSIAPGLEDNLDSEGFVTALSLIQNEVPNSESVSYVRSACYKCPFTRLSDATVAEESHTLAMKSIPSMGILHNDGDYFKFSDEKDKKNKFPLLSTYKKFVKKANEMGSAFILWTGKYQDAPPSLVPTSPDTRTYKVPTASEEKEIINLLRTQ